MSLQPGHESCWHCSTCDLPHCSDCHPEGLTCRCEPQSPHQFVVGHNALVCKCGWQVELADPRSLREMVGAARQHHFGLPRPLRYGQEGE